MTTSTSTAPRLGDLILARLLTVGKRPPAPSRLRQEMMRFVKHALNNEQWQALVEELTAAGLLLVRPYRLTETGRAQALAFLGIEALPPRGNWMAIQARYLVPRALDIADEDAQARQKASREDGLAALLLERHYQLDLETPTLPKILGALAHRQLCRLLGLDEKVDAKAIQAALLGRLLGGDENLDAKTIGKQLPRKLVEAHARGVRGLREAIVRRWLNGEVLTEEERNNSEVAETPFDLAAFAATVHRAARHCPNGRFGDNKVFIAALWNYLQNEPSFPRLDLAAFKTRLTEANRNNLLQLSRADLVEAMNPAEVRESATPYLNTVFHFVLVPQEQL